MTIGSVWLKVQGSIIRCIIAESQLRCMWRKFCDNRRGYHPTWQLAANEANAGVANATRANAGSGNPAIAGVADYTRAGDANTQWNNRPPQATNPETNSHPQPNAMCNNSNNLVIAGVNGVNADGADVGTEHADYVGAQADGAQADGACQAASMDETRNMKDLLTHIGKLCTDHTHSDGTCHGDTARDTLEQIVRSLSDGAVNSPPLGFPLASPKGATGSLPASTRPRPPPPPAIAVPNTQASPPIMQSDVTTPTMQPPTRTMHAIAVPSTGSSPTVGNEWNRAFFANRQFNGYNCAQHSLALKALRQKLLDENVQQITLTGTDVISQIMYRAKGKPEYDVVTDKTTKWSWWDMLTQMTSPSLDNIFSDNDSTVETCLIIKRSTKDVCLAKSARNCGRDEDDPWDFLLVVREGAATKRIRS